MDLELRWLTPLDLVDGRDNGLIYDVGDLDRIPDAPGIYIFSRLHGDAVSPLYIGRAESLLRRIEQQLNNLRLMRAIEDAPSGYRTLHIGLLVAKKAQKFSKAIAVIESALISTALVEGFELINIKGTKTLVHTIASSGNREARSWLPDNTIRLRRA